MSKKLYIIFDARACCDGDAGSATVLDMADSLEEAREAGKLVGQRCAIYEYDREGGEAKNGHWVEDVR